MRSMIVLGEASNLAWHHTSGSWRPATGRRHPSHPSQTVVVAMALYFAIATPNHTAYGKVLNAVHCYDKGFRLRRTVREGVYWVVTEVLRLGNKIYKAVARRRFAGPESLLSRKAVLSDGTAVGW